MRDDIAPWMDELWFKLKFQEAVAERDGISYQRLFESIMKTRSRDGFTIVIPAGGAGDLGCDGWETETGTVFAVYAPQVSGSRARIKAKMSADLQRAREQWPQMRSWRFVHNDRHGLRADALNVFHELLTMPINSTSGLAIQLLPPWDPSDLWQILRQQGINVMQQILGPAPWTVSSRWAPTWIADDGATETAASRTVGFLLDNFSDNAESYQATTATALSMCLIAYVLGDAEAFESTIPLLEHELEYDPLESMLTCCVIANRALVQATSAEESFEDIVNALKLTDPDNAEILDFLHEYAVAISEDEGPGMPTEPRHAIKLGTSMGWLTSLYLAFSAATQRRHPVHVLLDLFLMIQRLP